MASSAIARPIASAASRKAPSKDMPSVQRRLPIGRVERHAGLRELVGDELEAVGGRDAAALGGDHAPLGEQSAPPLPEAQGAAGLLGEPDTRSEPERERR